MYQVAVKNTYKTNGNKKSLKSKSSLVMIAIIILSLVLLPGFTSQGRKPQEYKIIEIKKGDTLWTIAEKHNINNEDPRKIVNDIKKINNLKNVILQPGQTLKIPER